MAEQIDHTPELPAQVRRQMAEADAIRAELNGTPPENQEPPPAPPAEQQEPAAPPPTSAVPVHEQPGAEDGQSWEQRFKSQAGRLEQATRANQQLHDRLAQLEQTLTVLQARGVEPPPPPQPKQKPKLITPEEENDFGTELLGVVGKRAREEFAPEFEDLAERLKRLEGRVDGATQVVERSQTQTVYQTLTNAVPEWRQINRSPDFLAWLEQPDAFSGRRRNDMLQEAFSRHETNRVIAFFQGFLTEATGLPSGSSSPGNLAPPLAPPNGAGNGSGKPSLEDFAAPGRARSAPQNLPPEKPTYTQAWIEKFMADKRTGKYRGREADADAIERDIYQAQHEGRIH